MANKTNEVNEYVDKIRDRIVSYSQRLIQFPTTSGNEADAQSYVKEVMESIGCDHTDVWEPDYQELSGHPAFVSGRDGFEGSPNLAGVWKGEGGGRSLILCSHIDVVPEGNHEMWTFPPFDGAVNDGTIYGRGVSDMKGSMAAMFGAIETLRALNIKLKGDVTIISTIEEETGSAGSLSVALRGYSADVAIIPEPTGFKICPAQQGAARFKISIKGKSAHAGQKYFGVNAMEKADIVRRGIDKYEVFLNKTYKSTLYENVDVPFTINVGVFQSGDWFCTVPEDAYMEGRMAIPPGMTVDSALDNLRQFIWEEIKTDDWLKEHVPDVQLYDCWWGPSSIDQDHPIVDISRRALEEVTEKQPCIEGTPWGTDGRMFTEFANTPSLVFGPGTSAHCPDEFLPVDDLIDYTKILTKVIIDWCGVA